MPRIGKNELEAKLKVAEQAIADFEAPAAGPNVPDQQANETYTPDINSIKEQSAAQSAKKRAEAIVDFLDIYTPQVVKEEIDRQQILEALSSLRTEVDRLSEILRRNGIQ